MKPQLWSVSLIAVLAFSAAPTATSKGDEVDLSALKRIERRVLASTVEEGPAKFQSLVDYYRAANPKVVARFERAKATLDAKQEKPFRMLTLVAGDAGIGKTFIKSQAFRKGYDKSTVFKFDLGELYSTWSKDGSVDNRPDLYAEPPDGGKDELVLSRLQIVREDAPHPLVRYLEAQDAAIYVVDSLDEIHPDDCSRVLHQIERFVFESDRPFLHVIVLGRSVAFREYWHERAGFYSPESMSLFVINPPQFKTTGDLLVSGLSYHSYFYKLKWRNPAKGEFESMPLSEYSSWAKNGFQQGADNLTVRYEPNQSMNGDVQHTFETWARNHRVVNSMLYNLAGNGFARKIAEEYTLACKTYDEADVMDRYLQLWMERDAKSSGRPSASQPEQFNLYLRLLEDVAARYSQPQRLGDDGFFEVRYDDVIEVDVNGRRLRFPVHRILDRSGLKHADPRDTGRRYRFEPFWFHRHLASRYNERLRKQANDRMVNLR